MATPTQAVHQPTDADALTDPGMGFDDALLNAASSFDFFPRVVPAVSDLAFALSDSTDAFARHDDFTANFLAPGASQLIPDLPAAPPCGEPSALSAPSDAPRDALSESHSVRRAPTPPPLRVAPAIRKPSRDASLGSPVTLVRAPRVQAPQVMPTQRSALASDKEARRLQHNEMMRANRERANRKFADLEALLRTCARDSPRARPMRNKMQVLDRAMAQYPAMRARRAALRAALLLGAARDAGAAALLTASRTPADTLARLLLGAQSWKGAEVWARAPNGTFTLASALTSAQNMLATTRALYAFSARARRERTRDALVERAARLPASLWVPDLRVCGRRVPRAASAERAHVSTALYVPLAHGADGVAAAVLVLYHADDELVSHPPAGVRPFDADEVARVDDLAAAVRQTARLAG